MYCAAFRRWRGRRTAVGRKDKGGRRRAARATKRCLRSEKRNGTTGIAIKILGPDDAAVLRRIAPGVFDNPIQATRAEEFLADARHHIAVAVDGGLVIGFVSAVHYVHPDKARPDLWINEVSVAETHRHRGLASRLLHAVFDVARRIGCAEAWVLTDRANTAAMRLYLAAGRTEALTDHVMFTFRLDGGWMP